MRGTDKHIWRSGFRWCWFIEADLSPEFRLHYNGSAWTKRRAREDQDNAVFMVNAFKDMLDDGL